MATSTTTNKFFAQIPQLNNEKDWPVWKFEVTHALMAAEQWEFAMETADRGRQGYKNKKQKAFWHRRLAQAAISTS